MLHRVMGLFVCTYLTSLIDTQTHRDTQTDTALLLNTILWPSCLRDILFQQKEKRKYDSCLFFIHADCAATLFCNHHNVHSASGNKIPLGSQSCLFFFSCCIALSKMKPTCTHTLQHPVASHCPALSQSLTSHARLL